MASNEGGTAFTMYDDSDAELEEDSGEEDEDEFKENYAEALDDVKVKVETVQEENITFEEIYVLNNKETIKSIKQKTAADCDGDKKIIAIVSLKAILSELEFEYIDLSHLMANGNRFFIDGESMLYDLLSSDSCEPGQLLHFIFLVESVVYRYHSKDAVFSVVFFDDWEHVWSQSDRGHHILFLRRLMKDHLRRLSVDVYEVPDCWSDQWLDIVRRVPMAFMLVTLGTFGEAKSTHRRHDIKIGKPLRHHWMAFMTQGIDCTRFKPDQVTMNRIFAHYAPSVQCRGEKRYSNFYAKFWRILISHYSPPSLLPLSIASLPDHLEPSRFSFWCAVAGPLQPSLSPTDKGLLELLLLHSHLLSFLPLVSRSLRLTSAEKGFINHTKVVQFVDTFFASALQLIEVSPGLSLETRIDLFDMRLLTKLCFLPHVDISDLPDREVFAAGYQSVFGMPLSETGLQHFPDVAELFSEIEPAEEDIQETLMPLKWYPIKIPALDDILKDVSLEGEYLTGEELAAPKWKQFDEKHHWHTGKPLSDDYDRTHESFSSIPPKDKRQRRNWERQKMLYMRHMQMTGESLEGSKHFKQIVSQTSSEKEDKPNSAAGAKDANEKPTSAKEKAVHSKGGKEKPGGEQKEKSGKGGKGKGSGGKSSGKAADIIAKNKERLEQDRDIPRDQNAWNSCVDEMKSLPFDLALQRLDTFINVACTIDFKIKAYRERIRRCRHLWETTCIDVPKDWIALPNHAIPLAKAVMDTARILHTSYSSISSKHADCWADVVSTLLLMGFSKAASILRGAPSGDCEVVRETRFQLECMGELLSRMDRLDKDPRVDSFIPDTWQRKLLDVVDQHESALVIAPTSSGKTYVSYYCMEQVLRQSDDGVVVYVSPTKALVNQVAATVYARFAAKRMPPGRAVLGTFTRDFRQDAMNSQILVTVPECLAILLLSPHRQDWVQRLRYVIFDEVHTLGEEGTGLIWERLLNIVPCPFIALSATVANPEDLRIWMQSVQPETRVHCIIHSERYCDLKKMAVAVSDGKLELRGIHPLKALANPLVPTSSTVQDISSFIDMDPSEVVQVYDALVRVADQHSPSSLPKLQSMEDYFSDDVFISRPKVRHFLKHLFEYIRGNDLLTAVVHELPEGAFSRDPEKLSELEDITSDRVLDPKVVRKRRVNYIVNLINLLKTEKLLPAILFLDNRSEIEFIAKTITQYFENKEFTLFANDKNRTAIIKENEKLAKAAKKKKPVISGSKMEMEDMLRNDNMAVEKPMLHLHHPECSLAGRLAGKDKDYIFEKRLRFMSQNHIFKRCLSRGIAYHHAGLNNKMRTAVEGLFRRRYLQMVSATGTLAVGIHMPCKTAVFFKDTIWLSPLQYHQRSGRAGRRGFDMVGNVVFCSMEQHRIRHLLTAGLTSLKGDFTLSFSFILRLMIMLSVPESRSASVRAIKALINNSFVKVTQPQMEQQIKYFFLFSLQVLVDNEVLTIEGNPLSTAVFTSHLSYHDPYNLVFTLLLRQGLLHSLCSQCTDNDRSVRLLTVISHLFGRLPLGLSQRNDYYNNRLQRSQSLVVLPPLDSDFLEAIINYSTRLRTFIKQYCSVTIRQMNTGFFLPVSKIGLSTPTENHNSSLVTVLSQFRTTDASVAPLACLSGRSLHCLIDNALDSESLELWALNVYLNSKLLPEVNSDDLLNAYAVDFLRHGCLKHITEENNVQAGDVFDRLKDMNLTLMTINQSAIEMTGNRDDVVCRALKQLSDEFKEKYELAFPKVVFGAA